jgi:hypothetical protein
VGRVYETGLPIKVYEMPKGDEFCKLANWVLEVERLPQRVTKLKPALSAGFFVSYVKHYTFGL